MESRNFEGETIVDLHWHGPSGREILVEVRQTSTARDVREALLALAYALEAQRSADSALCVIAMSRLTPVRLNEELSRFRQVARPELAAKVYLASVNEHLEFFGSLPERSPEFLSSVRRAIQRQVAPTSSSRVSRQQVKAVLLERWLEGLEPVSIAELCRLTGASHPTASAAMNELREAGAAFPTGRGVLAVGGITAPVLCKLAGEHAKARRVVRYVDPTGLGRRPVQMASRLRDHPTDNKQRFAVAIGGVLGAMSFYEKLDITAPSRLDVSVFDGDLSFVRKLDAALIPVEADDERRPLLVVHLQRDCRPSNGTRHMGIASRLDCLADLQEAGLEAQADEFAHALINDARKAS